MRRRAGSVLVDGLLRGVSSVARLHPLARPARHGVEVLRDLPYRPGGGPEHRLDVWRPIDRPGPLPVVLCIHGGGFRILSKETHWLFGLLFARRGFVVFHVNYRLAPRHPFPSALEDVAAAYAFVAREAPAFGGDPSRLVLAGESAGANLATALTVAACWEREEPYARALHGLGVVPKAVVAACGMLQVSDPGRFARQGLRSRFVLDRISEVSDGYLGARAAGVQDRVVQERVVQDRVVQDRVVQDFGLADPLVVLERAGSPRRPLPPFFAPVGGADPILDDTRRLAAALRARGVPHAAPEYAGEPHAFHAFIFRESAQRCWRDTFEFLAQHV